VGRLADEDGASRGHRLEPGRGIDEVAGNHALPGRPQGDGSLPREDAGPGLKGGDQCAHTVHQVQGRANRPLGVVLLRSRSAPHRHDRVADELLNRPPVPLQNVSGEVKVAGEEVARLLGIAALGEGGEAD
jgi:hypothetical protein